MSLKCSMETNCSHRHATCASGKRKNECRFAYVTADYDLSSSMPVTDFIIICLSVYAHVHVCTLGVGGGGGGGGILTGVGGKFQNTLDPLFFSFLFLNLWK